MKPGKVSIIRALSKWGYCSRSEGIELVKSGRVFCHGQIIRDSNFPIDMNRDKVFVDGKLVQARGFLYGMLHKPRGVVVTRKDEQGRETVYSLLPQGLPFLSPVGRLDKASEGLLLFTNDTHWSASLLDPENHTEKIYHVQIPCIPSQSLFSSLEEGIEVEGDFLKARSASLVRMGEKNSWIEIVLDEGKNRHIRRLLKAFGIEVLRLLRISIGTLKLGNLGKGSFRFLEEKEKELLG